MALAKEFRVELCVPFGLPEPRVQQPILPPNVATELHSSSRSTLAKEFRVELCGVSLALAKEFRLELCGAKGLA